MSVDIKVPTLGESVTEATVGQWFKQVGDTVAADEPLVELETDKVTIEVPSPAAGTLEAIAAKEGETVGVGGLLGAVGNGAAAAPRPAAPAAAPAPAPAAPAPAPAASPASLAGEQTAALELTGQPGGVAAAAPETGSVPPSPSAQKLMADHGLPNGSIQGSGKHGQVLKEDVLAATTRQASATGSTVAAATAPAPGAASLTGTAAPVAVPQTRTAEPAAPHPADQVGQPAAAQPAAAPQAASPAPAAAPARATEPAARSAPAPQPAPAPVSTRGPVAADDATREERVRMTRLRQTIARRLKDAQNTAAMLTTFNEVDMKPVMDLRTQYKDLFEKKHGVKLGFMGFFTKAVVHALKEIPNVNAEIDGEDLIYKNYAHIGVAVGTDRGLVVPVVRNADQLSIAGIEREIARLARLARDNQLTMADMQGGTFTITNGGVYGSLMSTPILNAPQSGILGMHKIQDRPVVVGGQIVVRPMMYLALSYDHRIVDGKEAVTFLVRVKESLEAPERLVLDL
ncbi:MAG TPA: 2-oxoglutarate dehydrogenase complex dihydrolipoyllysine-residue succinyltransferase [Devosiaceae bacterium]|jgi:2-oxoglutarate dehydrogenase E2 component (dihydrolipoamide succinyltransferase)|nr:2-oxoglutarate dehydrogenase complex dihydrolipoyllysine-residue succinyltransferase [Devosiaceae bacterium]